MTDEVKCSRPGSVRQGRILCNSVHMMEGTKCLLECDHGMVPRHEEVTVCQEVSARNKPSRSLTVSREGPYKGFHKNPRIIV